MRSAGCAVLIGIAMTGCAPVATYPPDQGALDLSGPRTEPVPTLMTEAIRFAHYRYGEDGEFAINLPPGTPPQVYGWVIRRLGAGHPMQDPAEPTYHVTKVLVRGRHGFVDLFYPTEGGAYQFATISLEGDFVSGYRHVGTRLWSTGDEPPPPHFAPPDRESPPQPVIAAPGP